MISILLPAYNEQKNIVKCIKNIAVVLSKNNYRIIVVNDGSRDRTLEKLHRLRNKYPLVIINHPVNLGVASALRSGLKEVVNRSKSTNDILIVMEADGTSDPSLLIQMISKINRGDDIVIASRYQPGGKYLSFPPKRLALSHLANITFKLLFPHPSIRDYTIFYRAYRLEVLKKALDYYGETFIISKYFTANTEILIKISDFTKKIREIPFVYDYSQKSGKSSLKITLNLLQYFKFILSYKLLKPHE